MHKSLSQSESRRTQQLAFPMGTQQRRVSEQEALVSSQASHWPLGIDQEADSANVVDSSNRSDDNSAIPLRSSSGQNLSDGALCRPQVPSFTKETSHDAKGPMSLNEGAYAGKSSIISSTGNPSSDNAFVKAVTDVNLL